MSTFAHYRKGIEALEYAQGNEAVKGLEREFYGEQLREMGLFCPKNRRLRGDLLSLYSDLKGDCSEEGVGFISLVTPKGLEGMA